ncbi:hypothetical protein E4U24_005666 [Claviceps purpurea]|nr:hypothetical protein E4U24_005666 [Claviceps purpurea]
MDRGPVAGDRVTSARSGSFYKDGIQGEVFGFGSSCHGATTDQRCIIWTAICSISRFGHPCSRPRADRPIAPCEQARLVTGGVHVNQEPDARPVHEHESA